MMKFTVEEARHIVLNCAKSYQKLLEDKEFLIVYRDRLDGRIKYIELVFLAHNFQHLTGMNMIDDHKNIVKHQSVDFYRKCVENRIKKSELSFREDGMSQLKLQALPAIMRLTSITKIAGDSNGKQPYLIVDKIVGGVNFCLGLRKDSTIGKYVPVSALQRDIKEITANPSQVLFIMEREYGETAAFKRIKHVAKGLNLLNLILPEEISGVVSLDEYKPRVRHLGIDER